MPPGGPEVPGNTRRRAGAGRGAAIAVRRRMRLAKLAFALVTLGISLASLAAGCKGTVLVNGEDPSCPASFPDGQACSASGLTCSYEAAGCDLVYECDGDSWRIHDSACAGSCPGGSQGDACLEVGDFCGFGEGCSYEEWECLADHTWNVVYYDEGGDCCYGECECYPYCPDVAPEEGAYCDPCWDGPFCTFGVTTACGEQSVSMECGADFTWHVVEPPPACDCSAHVFVEDCEADPACRYLTGGCEAPSLEQEKGGCFPKTDCSADVPCPEGTACTTVNANTCTFDPCIECTTVSLCL